jgi:VWFA-related protein
MCTKSLSACVVVFALCTSPGISSQPSQTGTALEFFAVGSDGRPVTDLGRDDLTLRIGGRARTISAMRWVPAAARQPSALKPPFGSNVQSENARAIVLVLDEESFRPGREHVLRSAVERFLEQLSADDRVALVTVPYGGLKTDLTTNHEEVRQAVNRTVGQSPPEQTGSDFACRTRRTLESITGLLDSLQGGRGPTTVLFVSGGLAPPRRDAAAALAPGMCELTIDHFEQVGNAASAARAHFFIIQPDDVTATSGSTTPVSSGGFVESENPLAGLEHLAGVTAGHRFQLINAKDSGLERAARETAGHYVIEFVPEPSERNGRRHTVGLKVGRAGVEIRARPTVVVVRPDTAPAKPVAPRDMLRQARAFSNLPLRAIGYASRNERDDVKVLVAFEPADSKIVFKSAAAGLFDTKGRLAAQWTASSEELAASPIYTALIVPPGLYRLRVAAVDAEGRGGAADYAVTAVLPQAGGLTTSALVLGLSRADGFRAAMQFSSEPVATGYIEVYGVADAPRVTMEIAREERSAALVTVPAAIATTKDADRRIATAALPIGALPTGDYIVRAVVAVAGQASTVVMHTLRKVPR